jgi:hypothetical protein
VTMDLTGLVVPAATWSTETNKIGKSYDIAVLLGDKTEGKKAAARVPYRQARNAAKGKK